MSTNKLLEDIKIALEKSDKALISQSILKLIKKEPERWIALLHISDVIPNPTEINAFDETIRLLVLALLDIQHNDDFTNIHLIKELLPLSQFHTVFSTIRNKLENLPVWEKPIIALIQRFGAFIQDQEDLIYMEADNATNEKTYNLLNVTLSDDFPNRLGGSNTNLLSIYEDICESFQLVLSYCAYKYKNKLCGNIELLISPYNNTNFNDLLVLSGVWRIYKSLWEEIKYSGWTYDILTKEDNTLIYRPQDIEDYIRFKVAGIRKQEIDWEIGCFANLSNSFNSIKIQKEIIKKLAKSINIPQFNSEWDGKINVELFQKSLNQNWDSILELRLLDEYHYNNILNNVVLGKSPKVIKWEIYWKIISALKLLSKIFKVAFLYQLDKEVSDNILRKAIFINKNKLCSFLSANIGVSLKESEICIEILTFDSKLSHLEIWDTPLIEAGNNRILFIPSIINNGSPYRAAENICATWNEHIVDKKGYLFEDEIIQFLNSIPTINVHGNLKFKNKYNNDLECDIVAMWEEYLIFIEVKCTKAIFSPSDVFRARKRIDKAIDQLNIRRDACLENWEVFRKSAFKLELPVKPLSADKIILIAVTNVLEFTGWKTRDVIVTDEFCLRRFFDEANVEVYLGEERIGTMGKIREKELPTVAEFLTYLEDPPQVKNVRKHLKYAPISLPTINDTDPKIAMFSMSYVPPNDLDIVPTSP